MIELPSLPPEIRLLRNEEIERLRLRYPNLPPSPKHCPTCSGTKKFRWWCHPEPGERRIETYLCPCEDQWTMYLYFLNAGIGDGYQRQSWRDASGTETGAIDKVHSYLAKAPAYVKAGCGLILHGEAGAGKTFLSTMMIKHLLAMGYDCYFTTFTEMIDTYTGGWYDAEEKAWFHKRIKNAGILVLDDIGKEYQGKKKSGLPESTFDEVLRHRVAAANPTIITTNFNRSRLQEGYGGNVMSLLHERSATYEFTGEDFRATHWHRLEEEIEMGLTRPIVIA